MSLTGILRASYLWCMPDEQAGAALQSANASGRMDSLEKALALDSRLQTLETSIRERAPLSKPWWRDSKTVTVIGALIAAVLPLLKFMDESFRNSREYNRQIIEQKEKIRQTYLDRVVKPDISIYEQQKIFGLLANVSIDREMQTWAKDQLKETTESIKTAEKERDDAIKQKEDLCLQAGKERPRSTAQYQDLEKVSTLDDRITDLTSHLGRKFTIGKGCFSIGIEKKAIVNVPR